MAKKFSLTRKEKYLIAAYVVSFLVFLVFFFLFSKQIKMLFFVTGFIFLNISISSYKKNFQLPIEIEILTFAIVLCGYHYGLNAGLLIAIIGGLLSNVIYGYISPFLIPMLLGYVAVAFMAPFSGVFGIQTAGIIFSIVKNAIIFIIYHFAFNYDIGKNLSYGISNILINTILFLNLASFLSGIMV